MDFLTGLGISTPIATFLSFVAWLIKKFMDTAFEQSGERFRAENENGSPEKG